MDFLQITGILMFMFSVVLIIRRQLNIKNFSTTGKSGVYEVRSHKLDTAIERCNVIKVTTRSSKFDQETTAHFEIAHNLSTVILSDNYVVSGYYAIDKTEELPVESLRKKLNGTYNLNHIDKMNLKTPTCTLYEGHRLDEIYYIGKMENGIFVTYFIGNDKKKVIHDACNNYYLSFFAISIFLVAYSQTESHIFKVQTENFSLMNKYMHMSVLDNARFLLGIISYIIIMLFFINPASFLLWHQFCDSFKVHETRPFMVIKDSLYHETAMQKIFNNHFWIMMAANAIILLYIAYLFIHWYLTK